MNRLGNMFQYNDKVKQRWMKQRNNLLLNKETDLCTTGTLQVDAAQGAEQMVESLTEKTLELEERMNEIQEEKSDLVSNCIFIIL